MANLDRRDVLELLKLGGQLTYHAPTPEARQERWSFTTGAGEVLEISRRVGGMMRHNGDLAEVRRTWTATNFLSTISYELNPRLAARLEPRS